MSEHSWPTQDEHVWGPWMTKTGMPNPTEYRCCVHPACTASEERKVPVA